MTYVDAFFHNLTPRAARSTLEQVRRVLRRDGAFAFNVHYTTPDFLCFAASEAGRAWKMRGEYEMPGSGDRLTVEQSLDADFATQVITTTLRFRRTDSESGLVDERTSSRQARYYNRFELEYLIELFYRINREPSVVGSSPHLLYVGEKA